MFSLIGAFSEFEKSIIRERVISGLDNARKKGRIGGRPTNLTDEVRLKIVKMKGTGVPIRILRNTRFSEHLLI